MKSTIVLAAADHAALEELVHREDSGPRLNPMQVEALGELLANSKVLPNPERPADHVGLNQEVILASPNDPEDLFNFRIVMPEEEDTDADMISIAKPIALAALGRARGEVISWNTPGGVREMKIVAVKSSEEVSPSL